MPVPLPSKRRPLLRALVRRPWTAAARRSPALRRWCDKHHYITPHFTWRSYACTDGTPVPDALRGNARRFHFDLERFRHALGDLSLSVDGPYRTPERNRQVGGAADSRHTHADGGDFYASQVDGWIARARHLQSREQVLAIAERTFTGVGNENSGTLHLDSRPGPRVLFVTWRPGR